VTFGGTVSAAGGVCCTFDANRPQWVTLLRRTTGSAYVPVGRVHTCLTRDCLPGEDDRWSVTIRPTRTATYVARSVDPAGKTIWVPAASSRIVVRVLPASR